MAMMMPVIECISQLKLLWFIRKQKLADFQVFDNASRGPTGSLILLGKIRGFHLVTLGAAVVILSIAFGTFAQQVVTYPLRPHPTKNATTPLVFNYTSVPIIDTQDSPEVLAAMYSGLSNNHSALSDITPSCGTGNCVWELYPSLGVCANMIDLSSQISNNACNFTAFEEIFEAAGIENPGYPCLNYTLPFQVSNFVASANSQSFAIGNATLSNVVPLDVDDALSMQVFTLVTTAGSSASSLVSAYLIYQPNFNMNTNSSLSSPLAYGINFDLCVQTYNTTVSNGQTNTFVVSSQLLEHGLLEFENPAFSGGAGGFTIFTNLTTLPIDGFEIAVTEDGVGILSDSIQAFLVDDCYQLINDTSPETLVSYIKNEYCLTPVGNVFLEGVQSSNPLSAIEGVIQNLAVSLTNTFRAGSGGEAQIAQFQGTAFAPQIYVGTNYIWLVFPISLVSLTFVLLLATISKSQRLGSRVWKSSNMATLQGLHGDLHKNLGGLTSISEMEGKSKSLKVRFNMEGGKAEHGLEYRLVESKQEEYWKG